MMLRVDKVTGRARKTRRTGLQAEYCFDYRKAKPNRFDSKRASGTVAVILESDVALEDSNTRTTATADHDYVNVDVDVLVDVVVIGLCPPPGFG
jgi:hypothetical protein